MLLGELAGLLFEEPLEGSFGQPVCGSGGDLLDGPDVHVESGSVVAEGPLRDDLGPRSGDVVELLEFLGCESGGRHGSSCLAVASRWGWGFPIPACTHRLTSHKP